MGNSLATNAAFWGKMIVDGVPIQYRAMLLENGVVNVGTLFPIIQKVVK